MTFNNEACRVAIRKGNAFINCNILPWSEVPVFILDNGVEKTYNRLPIASAYFLNSRSDILVENKLTFDFLKRTINQKKTSFKTRHTHPQLDTDIKLQYINFKNTFLNTDRQSGVSENNIDNFELELDFIDDPVMELNYLELQSLAKVDKFNENITKLDFSKLLSRRSFFYNSKFLQFYQLAKILSDNFIETETINIDKSYTQASFDNFESVLDRVFFTCFLLKFKSDSKDINNNIEKILSKQQEDGSWQAESFFINNIGSKAITTVFCVELLKDYLKWT